MKNIVSVFCLLVFLCLPIGALAAEEPVLAEDTELAMKEAYWNTHAVVPLTDAQKQEVSDAWLAKEGHALDWTYDPSNGLRYYGTYSDCVVFMLPAAETGETFFEVAGWPFRHDSGFAIYAYRSGEFALLEDAYNQGWLTSSHILTICVRHDAYGLDIEYFGEYDGCHVAFVNSGLYAYADMISEIEVAGYTFWYPCIREMDVYKDGEYASLSDAYELGWLSDKVVGRLWNYYTNGIYEVPKTGDGFLLPGRILLFSGAGLMLLHRRRKYYK